MKNAFTLLCGLVVLPMLGCEHPKPMTFQDIASNPDYTRTSLHELDSKTAYDRIAELARLCWDDEHRPASEKVLEATGLVIAAVLAGPAAAGMRTRRVATAQFDPETRNGIVMMRHAGQARGDLGAIIEIKAKDKETELRVVLQGQAEKLHEVAQKWLRGERVCTGLTTRDVK